MGVSDREVRKLEQELRGADNAPVSITRKPRHRKQGRGRTSDTYQLHPCSPTGTAVPDRRDPVLIPVVHERHAIISSEVYPEPTPAVCVSLAACSDVLSEQAQAIGLPGLWVLETRTRAMSLRSSGELSTVSSRAEPSPILVRRGSRVRENAAPAGCGDPRAPPSTRRPPALGQAATPDQRRSCTVGLREHSAAVVARSATASRTPGSARAATRPRSSRMPDPVGGHSRLRFGRDDVCGNDNCYPWSSLAAATSAEPTSSSPNPNPSRRARLARGAARCFVRATAARSWASPPRAGGAHASAALRVPER
jgi:hypothetical protein